MEIVMIMIKRREPKLRWDTLRWWWWQRKVHAGSSVSSSSAYCNCFSLLCRVAWNFSQHQVFLHFNDDNSKRVTSGSPHNFHLMWCCCVLTYYGACGCEWVKEHSASASLSSSSSSWRLFRQFWKTWVWLRCCTARKCILQSMRKHTTKHEKEESFELYWFSLKCLSLWIFIHISSSF